MPLDLTFAACIKGHDLVCIWLLTLDFNICGVNTKMVTYLFGDIGDIATATVSNFYF